MTLRQSFISLVNEKIENAIEGLKEDIIEKTPIDTGKLKTSYEVIKKNRFNYTIKNDQKYAYQILILGRTGVGRGSLQLPAGMLPEVKKWQITHGGI